MAHLRFRLFSASGSSARADAPAGSRRHHQHHRPGPRYKPPGNGRAVWIATGLLVLLLALLVLRYGW